jgi:hypothetical protein
MVKRNLKQTSKGTTSVVQSVLFGDKIKSEWDQAKPTRPISSQIRLNERGSK